MYVYAFCAQNFNKKTMEFWQEPFNKRLMEGAWTTGEEGKATDVIYIIPSGTRPSEDLYKIYSYV